ncbi:MAG: single-stranded DNA-binding protein [Burkholderiaceae bacterium]|nr:single-stranded DNA-binding protein [Burkholderiaceae bacterium]
MGSVNKAIIIGNAGKDPEIKYTDAGVAVCTLTLATKHSWKQHDGSRQEKTEWHRIVFWGKLGEIVDKYVKKGSQVYVEGRLRTRKWTDQSGQEKYSTEIIADSMQMLGARMSGSGEESSGRSKPAESPSSSGASALDAMDDDIPF